MGTYEQILQTALTHFAEKNYNGTSLSSIASEVGIKKASIYNHFDSKQHLFLTAADRVYHHYLRELKELLRHNQDEEPEERLYQVLEWMTDYLSRDHYGKFYLHFLLFPPGKLKDLIHKQFLQFETACDALLLPVFEKIRRQNPEAASSARTMLDSFYCLLDGITIQMFYYSRTVQERKRQAAWRVYLAGIYS